MKYLVWTLIVLLVVLHQDYWLWESDTLIGGFMPSGLAYHVCVSLVASGLWMLATHYCWPTGLDEVSPDDGSAAREHEAQS